jgi:hypothetical protein
MSDCRLCINVVFEDHVQLLSQQLAILLPAHYIFSSLEELSAIQA